MGGTPWCCWSRPSSPQDGRRHRGGPLGTLLEGPGRLSPRRADCEARKTPREEGSGEVEHEASLGWEGVLRRVLQAPEAARLLSGSRYLPPWGAVFGISGLPYSVSLCRTVFV